ncbi:signal peptidase II [Candidatus Woesearchaeota archaeon]|nr:signal peptidase II [Candidatus Woesearchaeota archaeon]
MNISGKEDGKALLLLTAAIVAIDQLSKFLANKLSYPIDLGLLKIQLVKNTGAAFGLFKNSSLILGIIGIAFSAAILLFYRKTKSKTAKIGVGLILGGTTGNIIDRIFRGHVIDFIDFGFWPAFNVADASISIGIILLVIHYLKTKD